MVDKRMVVDTDIKVDIKAGIDPALEITMVAILDEVEDFRDEEEVVGEEVDVIEALDQQK